MVPVTGLDRDAPPLNISQKLRLLFLFVDQSRFVFSSKDLQGKMKQTKTVD